MIDIIKACTDLGTHVCGAELGPEVLINNYKKDISNTIVTVIKQEGKKELEKGNKKKNIDRINLFNVELYHVVRKSVLNGHVPLTIGGDHSIAIGSALASLSVFENMGIIWVDAHADYNTFDTTLTGNIHGLPLATITGQIPEGLTSFFQGSFIRPQNAVIVGARSIDMPEEMNNLKRAGVHLILDEDVKRIGIDKAMEEAFKYASDGTKGIHVSLDVDVINPTQAPGVSIPEEGGLSKEEFQNAVNKVIEHHDLVRSIDLVEFNPSYDKENKTLKIVLEALNNLLFAF